MALDKILTTASSGMSAESMQLNIIASNLANANSVGSSEKETYRAKSAVFSEVRNPVPGLSESDQPIGGVRVTDVKTSQKPLEKRYDPTNPLASSDGYVYVSDVNTVAEMTNMIEASRSYQADVDMMNSAKGLIMQTINVMNEK